MDEENEILQRLVRIETKLDVLNDHEKRIRFLERYAFILIGIFGLIMVVIQTFVKNNH